MPTLKLPFPEGKLRPYKLGAPRAFASRTSQVSGLIHSPLQRIAYSAAHVVADPLRTRDPWLKATIDWDATIAYRRYLWSLGLGVAEAMDTAQRGMGLDWKLSLELIRRSLAAARSEKNALIACGAGTDHLNPADAKNLDDVIRAYEHQCATIEKLGGRIILMASRALARVARNAADYEKVYGRILSQVKQPVILHWLGDMFDPALAGYWGSNNHRRAMQTCLGVIEANASKVDGIKISLLNKQLEIEMRRRLPQGVKMYTGDDFNYPELIAGDSQGYSHALLGIFDAIAPAAAAALEALGNGDTKTFHKILAPTVPLSREIFRAPTRFYKTGIVFMAYLNGWQNHFVMVGGQQSARSITHLSEVFRLADKAGLLRDPDLAAQRMKTVLETHGVL